MSLAKARELREKRAGLVQDGRDLQKLVADEGRDRFTSEEETQFDGIMGEVDTLKETIDGLEGREAKLKAHEEELGEFQERLVNHAKVTDTPVENAEERQIAYKKAFRNYVLYGMSECSKEDREVLMAGKNQFTNDEQRALATQVKGTNATGGFTVPVDMEARVVAALKQFGGMREVAFTFPTGDGRNLQIPTSDDTGNLAKIIAEATAITASTAVPFGQVTLEATMYHSGPIKISHELAQDSIIDIDAFVENAMQIRFGRKWNLDFTTRSSTETTGPHGIVNDSTGAVDVATLAALTPENLMDLQNAIDPAYWPNARWMFNTATFTGIRKLRQGTSDQFLWSPGLSQGAPDLLLGHEYTINQDVASFGTSGNKTIFYGDFSHYWIRDVAGISINRLTERFAEEGVVALLGYARVDGRSVFGSTVPSLKPYRCIIQAT